MCSPADAVNADDEVFVNAPPSDDPTCSRHVDIGAIRLVMETWVEDIRAEAGLPALSTVMYRRRRAIDHLDVALEFAQRRKVEVGLEDDKLCRSVQAAMGTKVIGSCAYCGCNFSVVAAVDMAELGTACGVCGRQGLLHNPVPLVRHPPANAEERWKRWLPW
ncbi:hypothetical protein BAE44_0006912 [Dichanthelium oligosanthes]|uniref:Uncharacterized protein n=1 Tax=Dichanthelium oligosanthes TaxID=888268 RepID=A0A1E5W449_9POAL|nr:hypothetical protein BAE44_0006912 [Dichanthelium oligosanthes]